MYKNKKIDVLAYDEKVRIPHKLNLLLVEKVEPDTHGIKASLESRPCIIHQVATIKQAAQKIRKQGGYDALLIDLIEESKSAEANSLSLIGDLARVIPVVVIDSQEDEAVAVKMIDAGAEDYLCDSMIALDPIVLCHAVHCAVYRFKHMRERLARKEDIIGEKDKVIHWMAGDYMQ